VGAKWTGEPAMSRVTTKKASALTKGRQIRGAQAYLHLRERIGVRFTSEAAHLGALTVRTDPFVKASDSRCRRCQVDFGLVLGIEAMPSCPHFVQNFVTALVVSSSGMTQF
jgi:hypothetical protein